MITYDGMDDALIGQASVWKSNEKVECAVYSGDKIVDLLMGDGMGAVEALEWIEYNIEGGYLGEDTPIVVWDIEEDD